MGPISLNGNCISPNSTGSLDSTGSVDPTDSLYLAGSLDMTGLFGSDAIIEPNVQMASLESTGPFEPAGQLDPIKGFSDSLDRKGIAERTRSLGPTGSLNPKEDGLIGPNKSSGPQWFQWNYWSSWLLGSDRLIGPDGIILIGPDRVIEPERGSAHQTRKAQWV